MALVHVGEEKGGQQGPNLEGASQIRSDVMQGPQRRYSLGELCLCSVSLRNRHVSGVQMMDFCNKTEHSKIILIY